MDHSETDVSVPSCVRQPFCEITSAEELPSKGLCQSESVEMHHDIGPSPSVQVSPHHSGGEGLSEEFKVTDRTACAFIHEQDDGE